MSRGRALVVAVALALAVTGCGDGATEEDRLPNVTLPSLTGGEPVDLGELRGPVVVNLWAQWCVPCERELPIYQRFHERHAEVVDVLGIDWQDTQADRARSLARQAGVTYPLVVDSEPEIRGQALPKLVLVDADGAIAYEAYVEITSLAQLEDLVTEHLGVRL